MLTDPPEVKDQALKVADLALPVVAVDVDGYIVYTNTRACSLFGYDSPDELLGKPIETLVPDKIHKIHRAHVSAWMENPHPRSMVGPAALIVGKHRTGAKLRLRVALQWDPVSSTGIALIHVIPESKRWWLQPKAGAAVLLLFAGILLAKMEVAISNTMLGASFGMLVALGSTAKKPGES